MSYLMSTVKYKLKEMRLSMGGYTPTGSVKPAPKNTLEEVYKLTMLAIKYGDITDDKEKAQFQINYHGVPFVITLCYVTKLSDVSIRIIGEHGIDAKPTFKDKFNKFMNKISPRENFAEINVDGQTYKVAKRGMHDNLVLELSKRLTFQKTL